MMLRNTMLFACAFVGLHGAAQTTAPAGALAPAAAAAGKGQASSIATSAELPQSPSAQTNTQKSPVPTVGAGATPPTAMQLYTAGSGSPVPASAGQQSGPVISLSEAITRAKNVDHNYASALADRGTADAERTIARADLLPNVDYHNQAIYTQPQHPYNAAPTSGSAGAATTSPAPIFIANNAVREYVSQGVVTETIGYGRVQALRKSYADAAVAKAKLEVARRGLVATVVGAYYGVLSANEKLAVATRALDEANRFVTVSSQLEAGGEGAHVDVLKAKIEQSQKERDLQDAQLAAMKARLELGVLLFPDPMQPYSLATDMSAPPALPAREELAANAKNANPDVQVAMASLRSAQLGVTTNTASYFPDLSLAYNYGIDSDHFATHDANGVRNLGYAATATIDIPVWDWFATAAKVKQSKLQRDLAKADLTAAQRRAVTAFEEYYSEAEVASKQLLSLERDVADARQALQLTTDKYRAGEGAVLEVVDAQNTLTTVENARADGIVRYYVALANIQTMTGNLSQ